MTRSTKLYALAFIEGGSVMAIELIASRLIAPYYGASFYVWVGVIGATLIALAAAYYLGQYLTVVRNNLESIGILLVSSATYLALIPILTPFVLYVSFRAGLVLGASLSAIIIIVPAIICLAATAPLLINLISSERKVESELSGKVFAISTIGGIMATFFTGFYLIPEYGILIPLWTISIILMLIGLYYSKAYKWTAHFIGLFIFFSTIQLYGSEKAFSFTYSLFNDVTDVGYIKTKLYHEEGLLGQLTVIDFEGDSVMDRCLQINGVSQTCINLNTEYQASYWQYVHTISALSTAHPKGAKVLLLGLAGGSLLKELTDAGHQVDVVDLDSRMPEIARKYFFVSKTADIRFVEDDARHFIRSCSTTYDLVIFDIANAEVQPAYLYSMESMQEVKLILNESGTMIINFQGFVNQSNKAFLSIYKTMESIGFKDVKTWYNYPDYLSDVLFVASNDIAKYSNLTKEKLNPCCANQEYILSYIQDPFINFEGDRSTGEIMHDDKPILDHLNREGIFKWRTSAMLTYSREDVRSGNSLYK